MSTTTMINETHDAQLRSWVESANAPDTDFPIQNLPFGIFRRAGSGEPYRGGVAIGSQVLDLAAARAADAFEGQALAAAAAEAASQSTLNALMAMGPQAWSALRLALSRALRQGSGLQDRLAGCLVAQTDVEHAVPADIGDYTDFYTSVHHATNIGRLFRPDNPLLPNYKWVPIGYHGRSSTIVVSGQAFRRPVGQTLPPGASAPAFGPSKRLDIESELAIYIGPGNAQGEPIAIADAEQHVFGMGLLNDWSARDIQAWEYQPLGPFLSKSFASTVSPWIVTLEALAPYRQAWSRPEGDPQPLPYLDSAETRSQGAFDIRMEVWLATEQMRTKGQPAVKLSATTFAHAYWTIAQMVAHHTVNGCALRPGDLFGSGTESGPTLDEAGSLIELTLGGKQPINLPGGETRTFLEDGDTIELRAWCAKPGHARIGLGSCSGTVLPAAAYPTRQPTER